MPAAGPKALVLVGSEWIEMEVVQLGRSNFFLSSRDLHLRRAVRKRSWSFQEQDSILMRRQHLVYRPDRRRLRGVGAELSSLSTDDQQRW